MTDDLPTADEIQAEADADVRAYQRRMAIIEALWIIGSILVAGGLALWLTADRLGSALVGPIIQ